MEVPWREHKANKIKEIETKKLVLERLKMEDSQLSEVIKGLGIYD